MRAIVAAYLALMACGHPAAPPKDPTPLDTANEVRAGQCLGACIVVAIQSNTTTTVDRCAEDCHAGVGIDPERVLGRAQHNR